MTATAIERNYEQELASAQTELEKLNAEYDRLAASGDEHAMTRISTQISVAQERRRRIEAAQRGENEERRTEAARADKDRRATAYASSTEAIATVQRWAVILETALEAARDAFAQIREAESEVVPPLGPYMVAQARHRDRVSDLRPLLVELSEIEQLLKSHPHSGVSTAVRRRCANAAGVVSDILSLETGS